MSIEDRINNVKGSFAMEGIKMTSGDEQRAREIISGTRNVEDIVAELKQKYLMKVNSI